MAAPVSVRSYDAIQSGATNDETVLTASAIRARGIKKLFSMEIPDDPRLDAQPLAVGNVRTGDGSIRNLIFQASMGNTVYAFDADTGALVWKTNLGHPIDQTTAIDMHLSNKNWGILSTPVIDTSAGILYACAWVSPNGNWKKGQHHLFRLRLGDGQQAGPPLNLEINTDYQAPGLPKQTFQSAQRKQRAGLNILNGHVIIAFGSVQETGKTSRGWIIAVDSKTFEVSALWASTVTNSGGGIWQSGAAPSVSSDGSIFVITGNGSFDPTKGDFSESIVKLALPSDLSRRLTVRSWWTPWTDKSRTANIPPADHNNAARPSNLQVSRVVGKAIHLGLLKMAPDGTTVRTGISPNDTEDPALATLIEEQLKISGTQLDWGDQDFGSGGPVVAEQFGLVLAAGKDGILYTADAADLGDTTAGSLDPANTKANYDKLRFPPILYTFFDPGIEPQPDHSELLNWLADQATHHLHGSPLLWKSTKLGWMHFVGGENGTLRVWSLSADGKSTFLASSNEIASAQSQRPFGGMPGWSPCLASNQGNDGIVVAMVPYKDSNMPEPGTSGSPGRFLVYDAQNFAAQADGSQTLEVIWDSEDWGPEHAFTHPKFNRPVVWNGKIYRPTYDGRIDVYGLA